MDKRDQFGLDEGGQFELDERGQDGLDFPATLQTSNFAKVYATYGGFFIVLSLVWALIFDKYVPTKYDVIGALIALIGVCIIYYSPRP